MSSPSGRGTPLRAGSPRCCNDRRPGSGSPHPPHGGGSPIRFGLVRHPEAVGPHARFITRCILESNGSPAHHPPLPGTVNPVCATREHVRPPALQAPLVRKSQTLQGGKRSWLG